MRSVLTVMAMGLAALLSGCGADGAPVKPDLGLAVGINKNGISVRPKATVAAGPVKVKADL